MFPADHGDVRGRLIAFDQVTGQTKWAVNEMFQVYSGPLTTDGGVLFYGTLDGWFKAADQATGKILYQFKAPSGIIGNPITYTQKGKQYVAVLTGVGGRRSGSPKVSPKGARGWAPWGSPRRSPTTRTWVEPWSFFRWSRARVNFDPLAALYPPGRANRARIPRRSRGRDAGDRQCGLLQSASQDADDQHILWDLDPNVLQ